MKPTLIELNIPAFPGGPLPDPDKAPVTIDGVPFHNVTDVQVTAGTHNSTYIAITFNADVKGQIATDTYKRLERKS